MSDMYLTEDDFNFQSTNTELKHKTENIVDFTSSVLLDLSDEDVAAINEVENIFESLKDSLFSNSDTILKVQLLGLSEEDKHKLLEVQAVLLNKWKEFGFTESFFHRLYHVQRKLNGSDLSTTENERLELLLKILNEQKTLVIAFNVMSSKDTPILLDVADYM
ncbi:hypothetical protein G6727_09000 [Polynucleobacter paneuropaeus]|nr:hypothetical protein [Polynucleobacter paneuropaeus]